MVPQEHNDFLLQTLPTAIPIVIGSQQPDSSVDNAFKSFQASHDHPLRLS
jgi:hypothetical protein